MKRAVTIALIAVMVFVCIPLTASAEELTLVTVNGKQVKESMTIAQVSALFGAPRLVTSSPFGGSAYSFYADAGYSDYLFLETNASGVIVHYATFANNFQAYNDYQRKTYSYQDVYSYTVGGYFGTQTNMSTFQTEIFSISFLRTSLVTTADYWAVYYGDEFTYQMGVQKHATLMFNAVCKFRGRAFSNYEFNESVYLVNEQLKENGSSIQDYVSGTGQTAYLRTVRTYEAAYSNYQVQNPVIFATSAYNYTVAENYKYSFLDFSADHSGTVTIGFVDPALFEEKAAVLLTEEEQALYDASLKLYNEGMELMDTIGDYYAEDPVYQALPLSAGKISDEVLQTTLKFTNSIRVAAGLQPYMLDESLNDRAQHKATLTQYLSYNGIANPSPHFPPQPAGVSDEFYAKAQVGANMGENLYHTSIGSSGPLWYSVYNALSDIDGDWIYNGHRYNILGPTMTTVGFGQAGAQGVHQFSGMTSNHGVEVVAWPSKGIMRYDMTQSNFMWTAKFFEGYNVTSASTVTVKRLNDGKSWIFNNSIQNSATKYFLASPGLQNMVSFYDNTISKSIGDVFEITVHNVTKTADGSTTDYTYRSCIKDYSPDEGGASVTGVAISANSLRISVGQTEKLRAAITPAGASNKMLYWVSSDASVAVVDEYGRVTGLKTGTATITAVSEDGQHTSSCTVTVRAGADIAGVVQVYRHTPTVINLMQGSTVVQQITLGAVSGSSALTAVPFLFETVPVGIYDLKIEKQDHLNYTITGIEITGASVDFTSRLQIIPVAGDITGDGQVGLDDVSEILKTANYNRTAATAANPKCDINGDGLIGLEDVSILLSTTNYNKVHTVVAYRDI